MAHKHAPIIEIENLQPKTTIAGYHVTWQEGSLIAYADLLPIDDQPARGFVLECGYNTATGRDPGNRQIDQGTTLTSKVRELMLTQMVCAGWRDISTNGRSIWQHITQIPAEVGRVQDQGKQHELVSVTSDQAAQIAPGRQLRSRVLSIPAKAGRRQSAGYSRTITALDVTFTCVRCGKPEVRSQFPGGRPPRFCLDCVKIVEREQTKRRVARLREVRKAEKHELVSVTQGEEKHYAKGT
ncbi:MAG: hypothetical protein ACRDHW_08115 [Ktedonobacteraceae bacterium]